MKEKLLHTPEGVRDIYNSECKRKSAVEKRIHHILELYGYQDIERCLSSLIEIIIH